MKRFLSILLLLVNISAFAQNNLPDPPKFKSASVIPESLPTTVKLSWQPSDSTDVAGYIVYKIVDNITTTLDTVRGRNTTSYEYTGSSANSISESFRMAAYDNDGYKSTITDPHATIFMTISYDKCDKKAKLENYATKENCSRRLQYTEYCRRCRTYISDRHSQSNERYRCWNKS